MAPRASRIAAILALVIFGATATRQGYGVPGEEGQPRCGTVEESRGAPEDYHIAPNDTIRALLIFARFPDGFDGTPCDSTEWPDPSAVPAWAPTIFEDGTPWDSASVTQYTDLVSQNKHLVRGRVYPSVVVLDSTIAAYWRAYPDSVDPDPRLKQANLDVLKQVVPALGSGVFDFDLNGDDFLDYAYIFYRVLPGLAWVEIESTAEEVHRRLEPFGVAEPTRALLDG